MRPTVEDPERERFPAGTLSRRDLLLAATLICGSAWGPSTWLRADEKPPSAKVVTESSPPTPAKPVAAEDFSFLDEKQKPRSVQGRALVEAADGSLLVQGLDGRIWRVSAARLQGRVASAQPFVPVGKVELGQQLVQELGAGFQSYATDNYVLCTNTSEAYARWCGGLLERLTSAFREYWKQRDRGFVTHAPTFPLVAVIFEQQSQFAEFATVDAGADVATAPGYFSILTNRIVLYDFAFDKRGKQPRNPAEIEQRLGAVIYNVATMIHEATHQIAFNCGMHTRLADNPLWLTEGMATYFETPDLKSKTGWKTAGLLNKSRLQRFKEFTTRRREPDSLTLLIRNDQRLINPETAEDAYAESWALTYFLIRKRPADYVRYLTFLAAKKPLDYPTPDQRLDEFTQIFGEIRTVESDFLKYLKPLRATS